MYFWYLSKFLLSHESRSIAILDHFQSWKSLQRRLGGWKGSKSFFIHSLLLFTQPGSQQTYHHSYYCFLPPWCAQFCLFTIFFIHFYVLYIECNVWWILPFNECSQRPSQFTNPNTFQRLNATVTGTEKCFQYRNWENKSFNYIDKFLYFIPWDADCNIFLSGPYDLFEIQIFCNLHPGAVIPDTWRDLVREEMMPPAHQPTSHCTLKSKLLQGSNSYKLD